MAIKKGAGPIYKLLLADAGNYAIIGPGSPNAAGGYCVTFVTDATGAGNITIVGRVGMNQSAEADTVGYAPWPYRKMSLNGAVGDGALATAVLALTAATITTVWIPASASEVGVLNGLSAGSCKMYSTAFGGPPTA